MEKLLAEDRIDKKRRFAVGSHTDRVNFNSVGFSNFRRRIANLFCDWRLFDQHDNDLVVDTDNRKVSSVANEIIEQFS